MCLVSGFGRQDGNLARPEKVGRQVRMEPAAFQARAQGKGGPARRCGQLSIAAGGIQGCAGIIRRCRMKCGIGLCGRCNIGDKYVCIDGPVFTQAELDKIPNEL